MNKIFSGIIPSDLKNIYNDMIDAVIEQDALSRPCKLVYDTNNDVECPNCIIDQFNGRSSNVYNGSGVIPFSDGQICPYCEGVGIIATEAYDTVYMGVLWRYKDFHKFGQTLQSQDGDIQTISLASHVPKIKNTKYMSVVLPIGSGSGYNEDIGYKYSRAGEPQPAGFGDDRYCFINWRRVS